MSAELVTVEKNDGVGIVTLNRPEKLNALTDDMFLLLRRHLVDLDEDDSVDAVIICGAGRAFSSGADVKQRQLRTAEEKERIGGLSARGARAVFMLNNMINWKPTIAAVHGYVLGAAFLLTLCCDLTVASENSKFQITEAVRGLGGLPHWWLISDMMGSERFANELALTGRYVGPDEAHQRGIINRVVPEGEHVNGAMQLVSEIRELPPIGVRSIIRTRRLRLDQAVLEIENRRPRYNVHHSKDFVESASAFIEKRERQPYVGA